MDLGIIHDSFLHFLFSLLDSDHVYKGKKKIIGWTLFLGIRNHGDSQSRWAIKGFWLLFHKNERVYQDFCSISCRKVIFYWIEPDHFLQSVSSD